MGIGDDREGLARMVERARRDLRAWADSDEKDLTVALTDLAAIVGDLLSETQDRLADEGYLGTDHARAGAGMRNEALAKVGEALVGDWDMTITNAWFLERMDIEVKGTATISWLNDAFLHVRSEFPADYSTWDWVIGRSDAHDRFQVLYHDERGTLRLFEMTFADGVWTMTREDPDFHQRVISTVEPDRIVGRTEASEDQGATWRKDFDLIWDRRA